MVDLAFGFLGVVVGLMLVVFRKKFIEISYKYQTETSGIRYTDAQRKAGYLVVLIFGAIFTIVGLWKIIQVFELL